LRVVTLKLSDDLLAEVEEVAKTLGWSRSEVIRQALRQYLHDFYRLQRRAEDTIQYKVVYVW